MKNMNENINLADELYDKIEKELGKLKKVKILVLGKMVQVSRPLSMLYSVRIY